MFGKAVEAFPFFSTKTKRKFTFSVDFFQQHVFGKAVEAFPFFFNKNEEKIHI